MRILPLLLAPALVAQVPNALPEAPMSAGERDQAIRMLKESRQGFLKAIEGLSPAQWAFKPAPDRWSIQECAEHIVTVEQVVQGKVITTALAGPREPLRRSEVKVTDGFILAALPDRSHKVQAPDTVAPKGRLTTQEAVLTAFGDCRKALGEQIETSPLDWRTRFGAHPFFGTLDLYQWVLLSSGHTARHTLQIEEVKRSPGFPPQATDQIQP
jgi:DinB superfamily